jgi:hypothetical protein
MSLPCLFLYETGQGDDVHLGWITDIKPRTAGVRVEFEVERSLPPMSHADIAKLTSELDVGKFELTHTHWAVKDVDLLPVLIKAGLLREADVKRQGADSRLARFGLTKSVTALRIHPTVFRVPPGKAEADLVSVMMPFEMTFDGVYNALNAACDTSSLRCQRADDIWDEAEVIQDVFSLIYRSRIVICDFSGRNPNVFYEAGIAHTLGKIVIPIAQNKDDVPFDLRHLRFVEYLNNNEGRAALQHTVTKKLRTITAK